jgi:hypothetical protein
VLAWRYYSDGRKKMKHLDEVKYIPQLLSLSEALALATPEPAASLVMIGSSEDTISLSDVGYILAHHQ